MKIDWKYWLPHFITWFLLLILIGCNIWLIKRELKLKLFGNSFYDYRSSGSSSSKNPKTFLGGGNGKPEGQPPKKDKKDDRDDRNEE